jgi:hypothetical protein
MNSQPYHRLYETETLSHNEPTVVIKVLQISVPYVYKVPLISVLVTRKHSDILVCYITGFLNACCSALRIEDSMSNMLIGTSPDGDQEGLSGVALCSATQKKMGDNLFSFTKILSI